MITRRRQPPFLDLLFLGFRDQPLEKGLRARRGDQLIPLALLNLCENALRDLALLRFRELPQRFKRLL
ncbi:MAG TPA: hypothetical protein VGR57_18070 [Ktedonobacterales bacterium]|nr:hypothetical protein [Ktedonobacterales bacterium]